MDAVPRGRAERVALSALVVTFLMTIAKVIVGLATSSVAVLSQALDSALDIVALGLVLVAVRIAGRPADASHHYGHGKAENLAAFAQTLLLAVIVVGLFWEAVGRLTGDPAQVAVTWYALALMGTSAVVDLVRVRYMARAGRAEHSDALKAGALNIAIDVGTAIVALLSLMFVRAGLEAADAVGALVVAAAVIAGAWRLGKHSVDVLMDRAPAAPTGAIAAAATSASGVTETRRVRVRDTGKQLFADVTVATGPTATLQRAHDIAEAVEREIERVAPGTDVVVHMEPTSEASGLVERAQAAASRVEGVHEVHNVLVHAFDAEPGARLHVTLHAKVMPGTSLADAHSLSDRLEAAVGSELGRGVRVDSHIEPLEPTAAGEDVTPARGDVVRDVTRAAESEADVLDCHEVVVTSTAGGLSVVAHVRGPGNLELDRMHAASERIETAIQAEHPEIGSVLIHFEPG